ncbi:MAG: hypothetical protein LBN71_06950 [Tannerella sp.]|jgi:hypothetical protein|nr:hypothetical protein [Tannerella sp.]
MLEYFKLQYRLINRRIREYGLHPVIGYALMLAVFAGFSEFLFYKTGFAAYIYSLLPLLAALNLSEAKRNDFLKSCFGTGHYRILRMCENVMIALPFAAFLFYKQCFLMAGIVVVISALASLMNTRTRFHLVIPTPFAKRPFEFTAGFRNAFLLFFAAYGLTGIALAVDNFNLGVFALALIILTIWSFCLKQENIHFVWMFSLTPCRFLARKLKTALWYSFLLCLPVCLCLSCFYWNQAWILAVVFLTGYAFFMLFVFAKYAAFPHEITLTKALLVSLCFFFPPLLVVMIPWLFYESVQQLKTILT